MDKVIYTIPLGRDGEPLPPQKGRAILTVSLRFFTSQILYGDNPRWENGVYVIPEQRIHIQPLLKKLCIPSAWKLAQRGIVTPVWVDPTLAYINILVESESFPQIPEGMIPPRIIVILDWQVGEYYVKDFDMSEVEKYRDNN
jgi:hypothetical protein